MQAITETTKHQALNLLFATREQEAAQRQADARNDMVAIAAALQRARERVALAQQQEAELREMYAEAHRREAAAWVAQREARTMLTPIRQWIQNRRRRTS